MSDIVRHYLISGSYRSDTALRSQELSSAVIDYMRDRDIEPERIMSYRVPYSVNPMQCGLKDIWLTMTDDERTKFFNDYPQIATAIMLMLGVEINLHIEGGEVVVAP